MRLRDLKKYIEDQVASLGGQDWRTASTFLLSNINGVKPAGAWLANGSSGLSNTLVGNATAAQLLDDTASETRFIAAVFGGNVVAGVEIDLRLRQAVLAPGSPALPSIRMDPSSVICELNTPPLANNDVDFIEGEPGAALSPSLCVTELEVRAPGGVWPSGGSIVLAGQLQVR